MMRWILRLLMLAVLGFGLLLAVVYPWAARTQTGYEIGRVPVFDPLSGYETVEIALDPSEEQVRVIVEITTTAPAGDLDGADVLEVTVSREGRTELARVLTLSDVEARLVSPQSQERLYSLEAGTLYSIRAEPYIFTFTPREPAPPLRTVHLVLLGGFFDFDHSVPPIGYGLIAIGFVGLVLSFRRRRANPNAQPPSQWGRR